LVGVETVNRTYCVSDLINENGSPFWERPSICPKEKRGTCLAEVRSVAAGSVNTRCNEKREHIKRVDVRLPTWDPRGFFMTCDLGHVVSRRSRWKASVSFGVGPARVIRRTQTGALHP
jgi:hypothetical protein